MGGGGGGGGGYGGGESLVSFSFSSSLILFVVYRLLPLIPLCVNNRPPVNPPL